MTGSRPFAPRRRIERKALLAARLLAAAVLAWPAAGWAQEKVGCENFKWPVAREMAAMGEAEGTQLASGAELDALPAAVTLKLVGNGDPEAFKQSPERAPRAGTSSGYLTLTVPADGVFAIALSRNAWLDVIQNGNFLKPSDFSGVEGCAALRKVIRFHLKAGDTLLQVSSVEADAIRLAVIRIEP